MEKIVFIGDSITKGTSYGGVTQTDTFAYRIGIANGYAAPNIINAGVNSDTSAGVLNRLSVDVIAQAPAVCVVMIGINDWQNGVPVATYQANIRAIFAQLIAAGIKPVGITSSLQRGSADAIAEFQPFLWVFEAEASAAGVPVVDLYREMADSYLYSTATAFAALYADIVHLTKAGHQFVADLAARGKHAGYFLRSAAAVVQPPIVVDSLSVAVADYILLGANSETISALKAARNGA